MEMNMPGIVIVNQERMTIHFKAIEIGDNFYYPYSWGYRKNSRNSEDYCGRSLSDSQSSVTITHVNMTERPASSFLRLFSRFLQYLFLKS